MDADYIRSRSARYPGAVDIEPEWTQEVMADEHLVELALEELAARASAGRSGLRVVDVGTSMPTRKSSAACRNAWPASGRDLATYNKAVSDDEEA